VWGEGGLMVMVCVGVVVVWGSFGGDCGVVGGMCGTEDGTQSLIRARQACYH
jgi:hypothetical protein